MASLLDERPASRGPILFGNALVRAQESRRKAADDERQARIAETRERRMSEQARTAERQRDQALSLQEQALRLKQIEMGTSLAEAKAGLEAKEILTRHREDAMEQFGKAVTAIGKLDEKADDYDLKVAEIQARNPQAFTFGEAVTKTLDGMLERKGKSRELYITSRTKADEHQKKLDESAAAFNTAKELGMQPTQATIDGFVFKKPEAPMTFNSFEEAQKANPNARITGTLDSAGKFIVNEIGTKAGGESVGSSLLPPETIKPVVPTPPTGFKILGQ